MQCQGKYTVTIHCIDCGNEYTYTRITKPHRKRYARKRCPSCASKRRREQDRLNPNRHTGNPPGRPRTRPSKIDFSYVLEEWELAVQNNRKRTKYDDVKRTHDLELSTKYGMTYEEFMRNKRNYMRRHSIPFYFGS